MGNPWDFIEDEPSRFVASQWYREGQLDERLKIITEMKLLLQYITKLHDVYHFSTDLVCDIVEELSDDEAAKLTHARGTSQAIDDAIHFWDDNKIMDIIKDLKLMYIVPTQDQESGK